MFYLTSKFHDNRVNAFGFMVGGGGLLKPPPPSQAQELQKIPGRIGLMTEGGGGPSDFFGSEILAKSDFFGSMKDVEIFLGRQKKQGFFGLRRNN